jgi:hypothetical protein
LLDKAPKLVDHQEARAMGRGQTTFHGVPITRRDLLAAVPVGMAVGRGAVVAGEGRPRIAAIVTEYRHKSHAQGIVDRFLDGYGWEGRHYRPSLEIVSLYVDQRPSSDLSREREQRHPGLKIYPTIAGALTLGGDRLAVDGVLIIGEHGTYPRNDKGQTLYPRHEFFQQTVDVFRRSGRSVPVFNDKHLSWNWEWAKSMVETAKAMGFPFMAGSSLPVTWRLPAVDVPLGAEVVEGVCVGYGGIDSYDFHGLESLQCLVERRKGGETGVRAVTAVRGVSVWKALQSGSWDAGGCDLELFEACLCRSFRLTSPRPGYGNAYPELAQMPALARDPVLYRIEYADGLKGSLLMLSGLVRDFTVAIRIRGQSEPLSTQMYLPGLSPGQTLPDFFNPLVRHVETLFTTGTPPFPVERTLLTTGVLATAIDSLQNGQKRIDTPELLRVRYRAPRESTFWRS